MTGDVYIMNLERIIEILKQNKESVWYNNDMWATGYNDGLDCAISVIQAEIEKNRAAQRRMDAATPQHVTE